MAQFRLTPYEVSVLTECPLHYHFMQQPQSLPVAPPPSAHLDERVRQAINRLYAKGGPARLPLKDLLASVGNYPQAHRMLEHYYRRLQRDWPLIMAANETLEINISIAGVSLQLVGLIDRLDRTRDGGILAIQVCTGSQAPPGEVDLRNQLTTTIYHLLVASTYPLKRPVRVQQLWLYHNQEATVELSEDEYRHNLSRLREPVQGLARGEVMARPGLHCETCPFQKHGCPVYAQNTDEDSENEFDASASGGKIPRRQWIFKI